ncbi:MAG TPA: ankyrin repeat domain-containing protein [Thermoanaerobaculia bacterium]|nr:ankyrin repeat domain-containing protein [Thermoanaerobaculia bacterium]
MMDLHAHDPRAVDVTKAIQKGEVDRLQQLLRDDPALATAGIVDAGGVRRSLLHVAADWPGHFPNGARTVAALIAAGADPNAHVTTANANETPLHWAASSDDVAVLDALLDGGADIEAPGAIFTGGPPMSDAVVFAQWNAARRLLERGARTTLWQAAALGLLDRVEQCFVERQPSADEVTNAFWHACRGGQRATAEFLLARGANPNRVGHDGKTPLAAAQESGHEELVAWLSEVARSRT